MKICYISPFSGEENAGHPNLDDIYYINYLENNSKNSIDYVTSEYVTNRVGTTKNINLIIKKKLNQESLISCIKFMLQLKIWRYDKLIFPLYNEKIVFSSALIAFIFLKYKWITIFTSNQFGKSRISRLRIFLVFYYKVIGLFIERIVVSSLYEGVVVQSLCGRNIKITKKKHHLCQKKKLCKREGQIIKIGYFGPNKKGERNTAILERIACILDENGYQFFLFKQKIPKSMENKKNIIVVNEWLNEETYYEKISNLDLLILGHTDGFEGKLSGNLCDAISLSIPFISNDIQPNREFLNYFQDTPGLIIQHIDDEKLIEALSPKNIANMTKSMLDSSVFEPDEIEKDLAFLL